MKISLITVTNGRSNLFSKIVLPSVCNLKSRNKFEWIVINHGSILSVKQAVQNTKKHNPDLEVLYKDLEYHGFGLGVARNIGLEFAKYPLVSYIDDDNTLDPSFIDKMSGVFLENWWARYALVIQQRRRDIFIDGKCVKRGKSFFSPSENVNIGDLLHPGKALFDSNGFVHFREGAPKWSEKLKIYIDYEYLLNVVQNWGEKSFVFMSDTLIHYIQTNEGQIGISTYRMWGTELEEIYESQKHRQLFSLYGIEIEILDLIRKYQRLGNKTPKSFVLNRVENGAKTE